MASDMVDVERPLSSSIEPWYRKFFTAFEYPEDKCLHELFSEQAERTPSRPCIVDPARNTSYTFAEVDHLTDEISEWLVSKGCGPDKVVAIYMDRRAEYFLAYVAILKAGGAYMPLEPAYPKDLLLNVLDDARPVAVLATAALARNVPASVTTFTMEGDDWVSKVEQCVQEAHAAGKRTRTRRASEPDDVAMVTYSAGMRPSPDNLAYVVYSSGTTGKPKGIQCPHRGAVHSYWWRYVNLPFEEGERVACNVFFVWEVLRAPLQGFPSYVIPDDAIYDPQAVVRFLREHQITRILFTPSLLSTVLDAVPDRELRDSLPHLRIVWLCGEVVTLNLRNRFVSTLRHVRLLNLYSISECHDVAVLDLSAYAPEDNEQRFTPVGQIFPNVVVALLDEQGRVVPQGEFGEICVGGVTLARGYLNKPDLNAKRFMATDLIAGEGDARSVPSGADPDRYRGLYWRRMYRTGDMGRFLSDGNLEVIGRCDFMVKIRGYSVNIGAIEAALTTSPFVKSTAVLAEGDEGTDKRLVAYVVLEGEEEAAAALAAWASEGDQNTTAVEVAPVFALARSAVEEAQRRAEGDPAPRKPAVDEARQALVAHFQAVLKARLPFYAVPAFFVQLRTLPIYETSSKLNRRALPSVQEAKEMGTLFVGAASRSAPPRNETERGVASLWALVLETGDDVAYGIDDSFFDVGGHSLTASRLRANLNSVFGVELAVKDVFSHPTVRQQATLIGALKGAGPGIGADEVIAAERSKLAAAELREIRDDARMLDAGIRPHAWQPRRVLLTGATGWVGAFLLYELLEQCPDAEIVCLVRGGSRPGAAKDKLLSNLAATGVLPRIRELPSRSASRDGALGRVTLLEGDLARPMLDLSADAFRALGKTLALVVHAAAHVNLVLPYRELAPANVDGTSELLRLCCVRPCPFYHVSSNSVFPTGAPDVVWFEYDRLDHLERLESGYAQSKWAAEQRVKLARQRGVPATILRLGNMAGDSRTGRWNSNDSVLHVITASIAVGAVPDVDWSIEMLPVDWVARMIVRLSLVPNTRNRVYNIAQARDRCPSLHTVAGWLRKAGYKVETLPYAAWCAKVEALADHELSAALPSYSSGNFVQDLSVFMDTKNFRKALRITGAHQEALPAITEQVFLFYLSKLREHGVVPAAEAGGDAVAEVKEMVDAVAAVA